MYTNDMKGVNAGEKNIGGPEEKMQLNLVKIFARASQTGQIGLKASGSLLPGCCSGWYPQIGAQRRQTTVVVGGLDSREDRA
jgi:hypothetical protein